jgi:hypothetical protein
VTDRVDVSGVLDAIDNALGWTDPGSDAMTVRYSDHGAGTPGNLAEDPGYRTIDFVPTPEGGGRHEMVMAADGIRWFRDGELVNFLPIVESPDMPEDTFSVGASVMTNHDPLFHSIVMGTARIAARPTPRHLNLEALRAAVAAAEYPQMVMSAALLEALQTFGHGFAERFRGVADIAARAGQQVQGFVTSFDDMRPKRVFGPPPPRPDHAAWSLALEARRNRNTGPARNPHRHRGI